MKLRVIAVAAGITALLLGITFFSPEEAGALPQNETDLIYLDASGDQVGWYFRGCDGQRIVEGVQTQYKLVNITACNTTVYSTECYINAAPVSCEEIPFRCVFIGGHWSCH